jgi:hypothetical protein
MRERRGGTFPARLASSVASKKCFTADALRFRRRIIALLWGALENLEACLAFIMLLRRSVDVRHSRSAFLY